MTLGTLVFRYSLFAILATLANLAAQEVVLAVNETFYGYILAVLFGTGVGLVLKYLLDKRWIFQDVSTGIKAHGKKFGLYTAMGIVTTAIFWGTETAFYLIWATDTARITGAVIGLAIGYVVKYHLDRRFVFTDATLASA